MAEISGVPLDRVPSRLQKYANRPYNVVSDSAFRRGANASFQFFLFLRSLTSIELGDPIDPDGHHVSVCQHLKTLRETAYVNNEGSGVSDYSLFVSFLSSDDLEELVERATNELSRRTSASDEQEAEVDDGLITD